MADKPRSSRAFLIALAVIVPLVCVCGIGALVLAGAGASIAALFGAHTYAAAPIDKIAPFVEAHPPVVEALGAPVSVSMTITHSLEREHRRDGTDHVYLMTAVAGSRGNGTLVATANNVNEQGWAGTWEVTADSRRVLRDGRYETEGGGVIARGTFASDGAPLPE